MSNESRSRDEAARGKTRALLGLSDTSRGSTVGWKVAATTLGIVCSVASYGAENEGPASPAPAPALNEVQEVVVTGSRIQRRDYEANSPIMTVDESLFKNASSAAVET